MSTNVYDIARIIQKPDSLTESELFKSHAGYRGDEDMLIEEIVQKMSANRGNIEFTSSFSCMSDKEFNSDVQVTNFIQFHDQFAFLPVSKKLILRKDVRTVKVYNKMIDLSNKEYVLDRGCSRPALEQVDSAYWILEGEYDLGELSNNPQKRLIRMIRELHLHMVCCTTSEEDGVSFNQVAISAGINMLFLIRILCQLGKIGETSMDKNTFRSIIESVELPMANQYDSTVDTQVMNEKAINMTRAVLWHTIGKTYDDNGDEDVVRTRAWVRMIENACSDDLLQMAVYPEFYVARVSSYIGSPLMKDIELCKEVALEVEQYNPVFYERFMPRILEREKATKSESNGNLIGSNRQLSPGASIYNIYDTTEQTGGIDGFSISSNEGKSLEDCNEEMFLLYDDNNKKKAVLCAREGKFTVIREYGSLKGWARWIPFKSFGFGVLCRMKFELADKVFATDRNDSTYWANAMLRGALGAEAGLWALACITSRRVPIQETDLSYLEIVPKISTAETNIVTPLGSNVLSSVSLLTEGCKILLKYEGIDGLMELRQNTNYIHCVKSEIDDKVTSLSRVAIVTNRVLG